MKFIRFFGISLLIIIFSCDRNDIKESLVVISIQPFEGIPEEDVRHVYTELAKIYPTVILRKSILLPEICYYKPRNRYRADSLIKFLLSLASKNEVIIGLTNKDISTTKGKIPDYGIMGLGYQPGRSCVVSTFRLDKKNIKTQFFKVCIHELGHTQGLPHCFERTCIMRDAEGKNYLDEETGFCSRCKPVLTDKNWDLE